MTDKPPRFIRCTCGAHPQGTFTGFPEPREEELPRMGDALREDARLVGAWWNGVGRVYTSKEESDAQGERFNAAFPALNRMRELAVPVCGCSPILARSIVADPWEETPERLVCERCHHDAHPDARCVADLGGLLRTGETT